MQKSSFRPNLNQPILRARKDLHGINALKVKLLTGISLLQLAASFGLSQNRHRCSIEHPLREKRN
jgi:hypothetical protein